MVSKWIDFEIGNHNGYKLIWISHLWFLAFGRATNVNGQKYDSQRLSGAIELIEIFIEVYS